MEPANISKACKGLWSLFFNCQSTDGSTPSCPVTATGSHRKEGVLLKSPLFSPTRRWWRRRQRESAVCEPRSKETRDDGDRHLNERRTRTGAAAGRAAAAAMRRTDGDAFVVQSHALNVAIFQISSVRQAGAGGLTGGIYCHRRSLNNMYLCLLYKSAPL